MFLNVIISSIITFQTWKKLAISRTFVEAWTYKRTCVKTSLKVTTLYSHVSPTMCNKSKKISRFKWSNNKTNNKDWSKFCRKNSFLSYRSSLSQMLYKIGDFKNFAKFIRKHLCWSLFFKKIVGWTLKAFSTENSITGVFLQILEN